MRILLDTQIVIVAALNPERLSKPLRAAILDPANQRYVSHVSLLEIVIKRGIGKLSMSDADFVETLADLAADELPIARRHIEGVAALPLLHRDPFDRLLIAQAIAESLTIATGDRQFDAYGVQLLPA